jgi:hypothetical protein
MKKPAEPKSAGHFLDGHRHPRLHRAATIAPWTESQAKISLFEYPGERERQNFSHGTYAYKPHDRQRFQCGLMNFST